jgi:hypothetical protein
MVQNRDLETFCLALAGGNPVFALELESDLFFLGTVAPLPERPLRHYIPAEIGAEADQRVHAFFEQLGLWAEFETHMESLDALLSHDLDQTLSPALRYALRLLPGALAGSRTVILGWESLAALDDSVRSRILRTFDDRIVLLVSRDLESPAPTFVTTTLLVDRSAIRGIGDSSWYDDADRSEIVDQIEDPRDAEERDASAWDDPDELDDDD